MHGVVLRKPFQVRKSVRWVQMFAVFLTVILLLMSAAADARRMGGGLSVGRQSQSVTNRTANTPAQRNNAQNARNGQQNQAAGQARKPWGGMLGGLAAGLGLAALFHALGFGGALGEIMGTVMLVVLVLMAFSFLRRMWGGGAQPQAAGSGAGSSAGDVQQRTGSGAWDNQAGFGQSFGTGAGSVAGVSNPVDAGSWGRLEVPPGFDVQGFEQVSKTNFIRLQKAWDAGDLSSLRAFLTDDLFDEMKKQLDERHMDFSGKTNQTDVVTLEAKLLGVEEVADGHMASVEFTGMIREDVSAGAEPFCEVWNLVKNNSVADSGWLLAGIQAIHS